MKADQYAVYHCRDTLELCRDTRECGAWIPMEMVWRKGPEGRFQAPVAAMPGYIFVPAANAESFHKKAAKGFYQHKRMTHPDGKLVYVDLDQLRLIRTIVSRPIKEEKLAPVFKEGEVVRVIAGPLQDYVGKIFKIRNDNQVRLQIGSLFITLSQRFLTQDI